MINCKIKFKKFEWKETDGCIQLKFKMSKFSSIESMNFRNYKQLNQITKANSKLKIKKQSFQISMTKISVRISCFLGNKKILIP